MKLRAIYLTGVIIGNIWMPNCECEKDFRVKFTPDDEPFSRQWGKTPFGCAMRDALLHITNDGDFQSCSILFCEMEAVYGDTTPTGKYQEIRKYAQVEPCKAIIDLFA